VERGSFKEGLIEKPDFLLANTSVFGEQSEGLTVSVQLRKVHHVLVDIVESALLGGCGEKDTSVSAFDCVFA